MKTDPFSAENVLKSMLKDKKKLRINWGYDEYNDRLRRLINYIRDKRRLK